jgi:hypothetical protein
MRNVTRSADIGQMFYAPGRLRPAQAGVMVWGIERVIGLLDLPDSAIHKQTVVKPWP